MQSTHKSLNMLFLTGVWVVADLTDSEGCPPLEVIHRHVQPDTEVVLVQLGIKMGPNEGAMGGVHPLPLTQYTRTQAACQLHLILNAAILRVHKPVVSQSGLFHSASSELRT